MADALGPVEMEKKVVHLIGLHFKRRQNELVELAWAHERSKIAQHNPTMNRSSGGEGRIAARKKN